MGTLYEDLCKFVPISRSVLRMGNVSDRSCRESQNRHLTTKNFSFLSKILIYEITWKKCDRTERDTDDNMWCRLYAR
jgi:hypothetical protein